MTKITDTTKNSSAADARRVGLKAFVMLPIPGWLHDYMGLLESKKVDRVIVKKSRSPGLTACRLSGDELKSLVEKARPTTKEKPGKPYYRQKDRW
jgi:hypothetical protein